MECVAAVSFAGKATAFQQALLGVTVMAMNVVRLLIVWVTTHA
jgi:hypothetical protein